MAAMSVMSAVSVSSGSLMTAEMAAGSVLGFKMAAEMLMGSVMVAGSVMASGSVMPAEMAYVSLMTMRAGSQLHVTVTLYVHSFKFKPQLKLDLF